MANLPIPKPRVAALEKDDSPQAAAKQFLKLGEAQVARLRAFMKKNKKPKPPTNPVYDPR